MQFKKNLILKYGSYYPIKIFADFKESDSLATLLTLLSKASDKDTAEIKYELKSTGDSWVAKAQKYIADNPETNKTPIFNKTESPAFQVKIQISSNNKTLLSSLIDSFSVFTRADGNSFVTKNFLKLSSFSILNIKELATLWHLPSNLVKTSGLSWGTEILSDPPLNLPTENVNFFAKTTFKNKETVFGIKDDDRRRHIWAIGKTGTGKSTLIANLAIDDIRKGKGIAVIDPHGDLADILLNHIPASRINDVIYLNPADREFPISINPLEVTDKDEAEFVVSGIIAIFSKIFGQFWGPRLEYVLRNALLTLTEVPDATLADVPRILTDRNFRLEITQNLNDKVLKSFWENEFENLPPNLQKEVVFPILNKIGQFVTSPLLRNVIDKPKSTINLEEVIESGKILIANLSQGKIGEDNGKLLGAMLITKLQLAAMKRVNINENERKDFYLYVDEFQNFATDSFIKILSEARKYHLNLMLANQYIDQIPPQVQKAILGNAGTLIAFSAGASDARILASEFANVFTQDNLINMQNYQIALRMMIDGHSERPFLATTLPLPSLVNGNKEKIIKVSRERWGKKAKEVV
ncbi:MAG TPA: type IV secretion system DNA-binding domain-containing protein [Patescibacteria group bacterium]|nr:type IV secretion system DNA-binding domain-containing protein [Patescibacteria group bacterium]